jgi:glycine/D-amino acid oxidase-like deaminating enzyme
VVIVGGGMTGTLIALTFAAEGIPVILLERGWVGCGSTSASSALLLQEPDHGLADLARRYGRTASRRLGLMRERIVNCWPIDRLRVADRTVRLKLG